MSVCVSTFLCLTVITDDGNDPPVPPKPSGYRAGEFIAKIKLILLKTRERSDVFGHAEVIRII